MTQKQKELFRNSVVIGTTSSGLFIKLIYLEHSGKSNHFLNGNFAVSQRRQGYVDDIKCFILNEGQFLTWFQKCLESSTYAVLPPLFPFGNDQKTTGNFRLSIVATGHLYIILDNRYSTQTSKEVSFTLFEEWEEEQNTQSSIHATIPTEDESLKIEIERMISDSKESLKIISSYMDMTLISKLLLKKHQGVSIQIILRNEKDIAGLSKDGFIQIQKQFPKNYRVHSDVHSRILIKDSMEAMISSADLTQKSLQGQFNLGITVSEPNTIKKIIEYFDNLWNKSKILTTKDSE
ncbi:MAG: phospholipase D family protein [Rhabdochlamydiaceae bacterium]